MLDMHTHLLHGVDDGCQSIEDSIKMIKKAIEVGVTDLVITPHYAPNRGYETECKVLKEKFSELVHKTKELELNINMYLGREIDVLNKLDVKLINKECYFLHNSKYVLVDFGMEKVDIDEYLYHLVIAGYKPIVAHAERYDYVKDYSLIKKWKKTGALIQVNARSLCKSKTKSIKKKLKYMLSNGLIDLVASDAHANPSVYDDLPKAIKFVEKKQRKKLFDLVTEFKKV